MLNARSQCDNATQRRALRAAPDPRCKRTSMLDVAARGTVRQLLSCVASRCGALRPGLVAIWSRSEK